MASPPLRTFNIRLQNLKIRYVPGKAPFYREADIVNNHFNPRQAKILYLLDKVPSDILRWVVNTDASAKALPLSTQRNRLRRRWNAAVIDALKKQGLDSKGRKIIQEQNTLEDKIQKATTTSKPFLRGTMEVVVYDGHGFDDNAAALAEQSDDIVRLILEKKGSTL